MSGEAQGLGRRAERRGEAVRLRRAAGEERARDAPAALGADGQENWESANKPGEKISHFRSFSF